jgi:hypothetical protein
MGDETEAQALPWAGLTWAEYRAQVMALSAYPEAHRQLCAQAGMIAELGELLALFDLRRVAKKGPPSREAVRAELGDVLWYAALDSDARAVTDDQWCAAPYNAGQRHYADGAHVAAQEILEAVKRVISDAGDWYTLASIAALCGRLGFGPREVAWSNLEKLRARREAGTLHDREARGSAGGGV